jgi:hypothetical protein
VPLAAAAVVDDDDDDDDDLILQLMLLRLLETITRLLDTIVCKCGRNRILLLCNDKHRSRAYMVNPLCLCCASQQAASQLKAINYVGVIDCAVHSTLD